VSVTKDEQVRSACSGRYIKSLSDNSTNHSIIASFLAIELQTGDMQYARMENRTCLILFGSLRWHHGRNMVRCMGLKLHDTRLMIRSSLRETSIIGHRIPTRLPRW
jgi:hypothetical protein